MRLWGGISIYKLNFYGLIQSIESILTKEYVALTILFITILVYFIFIGLCLKFINKKIDINNLKLISIFILILIGVLIIYALYRLLNIDFELILMYFTGSAVILISLYVLFRNFSVNNSSYLFWLKKPFLILMLTSISFWLNMYAYDNSNHYSSYNTRIFESITNAVKYLSGEFRTEAFSNYLDNNLYFNVVFYSISLSTFSITLLIVLSYLIENIFNDYIDKIKRREKKHYYLLGTLDEIVKFTPSISSNFIKHITIVIPSQENVDLLDAKRYIKNNIDPKHTFSIKVTSIKKNLVKGLLEKTNSSKKINNKYFDIKMLSLFTNSEYQLTILDEVLNYQKEYNMQNKYRFYIRVESIIDTTNYAQFLESKRLVNYKINIINEYTILANKFILDYKSIEKYNLDQKNKEKTKVNYILIGDNSALDELLKTLIVNYNFPKEDETIFNIESQFTVINTKKYSNKTFENTNRYKDYVKKHFKFNSDSKNDNHRLNLLPNIEKIVIDENISLEKSFISKIERLENKFDSKKAPETIDTYYEIIIDFLDDIESLYNSKLIQEIFKREFDTIHNFKIYCRTRKMQESNYLNLYSKIIYFGDEINLVSFENIVNDDFDDLIEKTYVKSQNKTNTEDMNNFDYIRALISFFGLKTKLNLIGFDLVQKNTNDNGIRYQIIDIKDANGVARDNFMRKYFDKSGLTKASKVVDNNDLIDYTKYIEYRNKLAYFEHARWNSIKLLHENYLPLSIKDFEKKLNERYMYCKNNDISEEIDVSSYREGLKHVCIGLHEDLLEIAKKVKVVSNKLETDRISFRVDYFYKDFLLMDSLYDEDFNLFD